MACQPQSPTFAPSAPPRPSPTPGPWGIDGGAVYGPADSIFRASPLAETWVPDSTFGAPSAAVFAAWRAEAKANLTLISAAPDMLAALREVVGTLTGRVHSHPALAALESAEAAIAKAEGRS